MRNRRAIILISGSGTNMQAIYEKCKVIDIMHVFSDRDCYGIERARSLGLQADYVKDDFFKTVHEYVLKEKIELIILAGFLRKVPEWFFSGAPPILNIHPALLPKYGGKGCYGEHVHEKVLHANEKFSGATVHIIDENYDKGRIYLRSFVNIEGLKTKEEIQQKVLKTEHNVYNLAITSFVREEL
ncbi:hypothetical protein HMPREF1634_00510 [Tissierellia bacterium S7-1-4]|nr:hypothetical protein HMPREF1634_00510 [Tissierellia bacterium S7-1-4]